MTLYLGKRRVELMHLGRAPHGGRHRRLRAGRQRVFSGDIVEYKSACYCGDAHFTDWPATLEAPRRLQAEALVPGRGDALVGADTVAEGIALHARLPARPLRAGAARRARAARSLKECFDEAMAAMRPKYGNWAIFEHCLPFNVARAYDEAQGIDTPRIWTAERDRAMWAALQG